MPNAVIVDACRTPIGTWRGKLSAVRADDLAALCLRGLIARTHVDPGDVEEVILGCANQAGEDNRNVARMALLVAGLPDSVPGATVNRLCGSGMDAWRSPRAQSRPARRTSCLQAESKACRARRS